MSTESGSLKQPWSSFMENSTRNIKKSFSKSQAMEAAELLSKRWKKNNLDLSIIKNKLVLNIGSGSGRYSYALNLLGAKKVISIDENDLNGIQEDGIEFKQSALTNLPLENETIDFVFCNGPLGHSKKWAEIFSEAKRVLKKGGWFWASFYGKGKVWNLADSIATKMSEEDAKNFQKYLELRDWPKNKIFFLLDSFFSNDRIYFTKKQAEAELKKAGFVNIKFLERGISTDLNEKLFQKPELKKFYGDGELRFLAQKRLSQNAEN
jgi:SAM-dependent methyltransferase